MKKANNLLIKFGRNNLFITLSTYNRKHLFNCSLGHLKEEKQKDFTSSLVYILKFMKPRLGITRAFYINVILEGTFNQSRIDLVYNELVKSGFIVVFIRIREKISHNGCRSKIRITKLRTRSYLN